MDACGVDDINLIKLSLPLPTYKAICVDGINPFLSATANMNSHLGVSIELEFFNNGQNFSNR